MLVYAGLCKPVLYNETLLYWFLGGSGGKEQEQGLYILRAMSREGQAWFAIRCSEDLKTSLELVFCVSMAMKL